MKDKWRLGLHLMPPRGWLNDPNGLCQFQGTYHVFFQYSPNEVHGGLKHWGHYISKDLLNWEFQGIALAPEHEFESRGVYSGSTLVEDEKMHVFYTGNVKLAGDYNYITNGRQNNTVYVCSEDGTHFGEKEWLLTNTDYPADLTCHVRDPKVVTGKSIGVDNDKIYMFLGARTDKDIGEVLVYASENKRNWTLVNRIGKEQKFGYMWECPDAFEVNGKKVLSISPQGVEQEGHNYQNLYQSGYYFLEGQFDRAYTLSTFKEWDRGFDFYAPQTFLDESGRRILIGWIGMPDVPEHTNPTAEFGWQNALTVPREIVEKDGKLLQIPVEELHKLRKEMHVLKNAEVSKKMKCYDARIEIESDDDFTVVISEGIRISYDRNMQVCTLEFDEKKNLGYGRKSRSVELASCRDIRILADTSCLEVYLNGGEEVFTTRFYTEDGMSSFCVEGNAKAIRYWELSEMKIEWTV